MHTNDENAFFVGEINKALFDEKRNHGAEIGALKTKKRAYGDKNSFCDAYNLLQFEKI